MYCIHVNKFDGDADLSLSLSNRWLYNNQLSGTIPSSIGSLARLTALYVNQSVSLVR